MVSRVYLTIDDAPSINMNKKIDFLTQCSIPALFFCRGEFIQMRPESVVYAIQNGFLIGNHSYSHPYFSEIPLVDCFDEITKTETLIEQCYQNADVRRPCKIIRLPFGDRGAGSNGQHPNTAEEKEKVEKIQQFLREQGFVAVDFGRPPNGFIDASWDWDTQDYKSKMMDNSELYIDQFSQQCDTSIQDPAILLLHDFDNNHHLFQLSMEFLMRHNISFLPANLSFPEMEKHPVI